jgi:hypothetical protein
MRRCRLTFAPPAISCVIGPSQTGIFRRSRSTFDVGETHLNNLRNFPSHKSLITGHYFVHCGGVGRGCGVGRGLGITLGVAVGVVVAVGVGVDVSVGVGVTVGVGVGAVGSPMIR